MTTTGMRDRIDWQAERDRISLPDATESAVEDEGCGRRAVAVATNTGRFPGIGG